MTEEGSDARWRTEKGVVCEPRLAGDSDQEPDGVHRHLAALVAHDTGGTTREGLGTDAWVRVAI
jgi:hypothetical protein